MINPMSFYSTNKITFNQLYNNTLNTRLLIHDNPLSVSYITQTIIYEDDFNCNIKQLYKLYETYYKFLTYLINNHNSLIKNKLKLNNILEIIGETSVFLEKNNFPIIRQKHNIKKINIKYCKHSKKWYI